MQVGELELLALIFKSSPGSEAPSQDQLHEQIVCAAGEAEADAKIKLPFGRKIQIESGHDLMLLFVPTAQARDWSERAVVFGSQRDHFGYIEADLGARGKLERFV